MTNNTYTIRITDSDRTLELTEDRIIAIIEQEWQDYDMPTDIIDIEQDKQDPNTFTATDDYGYETYWTLDAYKGRITAEPEEIPSKREHAKYAYSGN